MQTGCVGGGKTVGDPPADPTLEDGHWVHDSRGGSKQQTPTGGSGPGGSMPRRDKGDGEGPSPQWRGGELWLAQHW